MIIGIKNVYNMLSYSYCISLALKSFGRLYKAIFIFSDGLLFPFCITHAVKIIRRHARCLRLLQAQELPFCATLPID